MKRFDDTKDRASNFGISRRDADHKEKENINFSLGHVLVISSLVGKITLHKVVGYFFKITWNVYVTFEKRVARY